MPLVIVVLFIEPAVIATLPIVPPVIATEVEFCNDIVPSALVLVCTYAVVAIFVELSVATGVGAVGLPVNAGDILNTVLPVPVEVVVPVPPFNTGNTPVVCDDASATLADPHSGDKPAPLDLRTNPAVPTAAFVFSGPFNTVVPVALMLALIVPAEKLPDPSLATIVPAVLAVAECKPSNKSASKRLPDPSTVYNFVNMSAAVYVVAVNLVPSSVLMLTKLSSISLIFSGEPFKFLNVIAAMLFPNLY